MSMWETIRRNAKITQEEMAKKLGVSRVSVNRYEKGKSSIPVKHQIEYLKLRNSDEDKIIINYLKGML